jgi:hypothetical protein
MTSPALVDDEKLAERLRGLDCVPGMIAWDKYRNIYEEAASRLQALSEQARLHDAALSRLADYAEDIRKLTEDNARLREALNFYAARESWQQDRPFGDRPAMEDGGETARAALSASAAGSEVSTASNSVES